MFPFYFLSAISVFISGKPIWQFNVSMFIKPGRTAWSWETLSLGTPETQREFIDLAAEMGFEYSDGKLVLHIDRLDLYEMFDIQI